MTKQEISNLINKTPQVWGFLDEAINFAHKKYPNLPIANDKFCGKVNSYLIAVARWLN